MENDTMSVGMKTYTDIDEKKLVLSILQGDKEALRMLIKDLEKKLRPYLVNHVSNEKDSEELCQDILLSFLDALPLFSFRSSLWTFVLGIARHEVADYWRKKYAKRVIRSVPLVSSLYDQALYSSEIVSDDISERISHVYTLLTPTYRDILMWKYEDRLSIKDIAARMKTTVKATESVLYRARVSFQDLYTKLYGAPEFSVLSMD